MDTFLTHGRAAGTPRTSPVSTAATRRAGWPALLLTLTLAACGGGGSDSSSGSGSSGSGSGAAPDGQATCKLAADADFQKQLLDAINAARAAGANCGTSGTFAATTPLGWNALLAQAADNQSIDMSTNNFFSHTGSNGSTLGQRVTAVGYPWTALGENIAAGQTSVDSVMKGWLASPGHCANIMNPTFQEVGVSCRLAASTKNDYGTYWTMDLGARR
ncbi:CAP domain-containing protein [Roseateles terrae]|uniref:Uncharacterized protein YkwD n=1 Tax=Roseateles terrae TaxID=431060 RepID=A0ABR6GZI9_9BURK|nr:CAP domain-containing protein [Roseateles terrae]MBB3196679.1 uncharacterized protein YkwD [Roseateles terrae]OWQ84924.1 hypothetical protein CDN98_17890 [Roseateles terrae]